VKNHRKITFREVFLIFKALQVELGRVVS